MHRWTGHAEGKLVTYKESATLEIDNGSYKVISQCGKPTRLAYLADARSSHTAKWVNYFSGRGYEVHLLSFESPRGVSGDVHLHKLNAGVASRLRYFTAAKQVRRILAIVQPDLLHAHYASGYGTLGRLAHFHPYVLSVWGSDVFEFPQTSPLHRYLIAKNLASAEIVCSTSNVMATRTSQYYAGNIFITPFGVDCAQFRPDHITPDNGDFLVGTIKSLEDKYGIDYLIRAFTILKAQYTGKRKLRLVIGGEGSK